MSKKINRDESIFVEYFGNTPLVRILDFLIEGKDFDYSLTDIAKNTNVGWTSFSRVWKDLESMNAVKHTRNIGRAKLYKLNLEDETVKKLVRLHWEIIKGETNKMLRKQPKVMV